MMTPKLTSSIFLVIQSYLLLSAYSLESSLESLDDLENIDCDDLVKQKKCWSDITFMNEHCSKECWKWQLEQEKHDGFLIDDDNESFYDLSAKTFTGKKINFEQFEGLVTIVIDTALQCSLNPDDIERYFEPFEMLRRISPYAIDVVVFPFKLAEVDYTTQDCTIVKMASKDPIRMIHFMEVSEINGPDTHPVFKFLKKTASIDELQYDTATFFVVSAEGDKLDVHQNSMIGSFLEHLRERLRKDFDGGARREF